MGSFGQPQIPTGQYSPLRYPGGKGKLARFVADIIRSNGLSDGRYVEPYAGGAAIAWELLITGVVRRVCINDISKPVFAFWSSVLNQTDQLCKLINERPLSIHEWDRQKAVFRDPENHDLLELGFAFFYLNRTNRSGILNGGVIGGRSQSGPWKIDARFNRHALVNKIEKIAAHASRIEVTNLDATDFISRNSERFKTKTLLYIDPPYFDKGRFLYYDAYEPSDHVDVANTVNVLWGIHWIISYDDVAPIHDLYSNSAWVQYQLHYSARDAKQGREIMFFSPGLRVSEPLISIDEIRRGSPGDLKHLARAT